MKKKICMFFSILITASCLTGCLKTKVSVLEDYQGPILPLAVGSNADGIIAKRHITCDYTQYNYSEEYFQYNPAEKECREVTIWDQYVLKNTTNEDVVLNLVYGFAGGYITDVDKVPTLEVDGEFVESELIVGKNPVSYGFNYDGRGFNMVDRESFENLLSSGEYREDAFDVAQNDITLSDTVTVYKFENVKYTLGNDTDIPFAELVVSFDPEETEIWTHEVVRKDEEGSATALGFTLQRLTEFGYGKDVYIIAIGEELDVQGVKCYHHYMSDKETDEFSLDYVKYKATLEDVLREIVTNSKSDYHSPGTIYNRLSNEQILKVGKADLMDCDETIIALEDQVFKMYSDMRVFYKSAEIVVPANDTVEIIWKYKKYVGIKNIDDENYDGMEIMTNLDSDLKIERQTLKVLGAEDLQISEHTTGELLEKGQYEVEMTDRYFEIYLEVPEKEYNRKGWWNRES